jgi:serine/threonine-protein kinase
VPADVELPELAGLDLAAAQKRLAALGLLMDVAAEADSSAARGTVLAADPAAGSTAVPGATVQVTVASGFTSVPPVLGAAPDAVDSALVTAGLARDTTVLTEVKAGAVAGSVLRAVPPAGSRLPIGSPVRLVIAAQVEPVPTGTPTTSPSPSLTPSPTPGPVSAP